MLCNFFANLLSFTYQEYCTLKDETCSDDSTPFESHPAAGADLELIRATNNHQSNANDGKQSKELGAFNYLKKTIIA